MSAYRKWVVSEARRRIKRKAVQYLGVTDSAVKRRCVKRGIDTPGRGYWSKQAREMRS